MYYVYMLESEADGDLYKGSSANYLMRFEEHNRGECTYTRTKLPWRLVFVQAFETKRDALIKEKQLKRCNKAYLQWLIRQPVNMMNKDW